MREFGDLELVLYWYADCYRNGTAKLLPLPARVHMSVQNRSSVLQVNHVVFNILSYFVY